MFLSIVTPTYNRAHLLKRCYESLCKIKKKEFEWIIIDDGSVDQTKEIIAEMQMKAGFKINYIKKKNGGKHTALNLSTKYVIGDYVFVLDSDDWLGVDTVDVIENYVEKYRNDDSIAGFSFHKATSNGRFIGGKYKKAEEKCNFVDYVLNRREAKGERLEVLKREWYCKFLYPEVEGEHFFSEIYTMLNISNYKDLVYIDYSFYFAEYQEDGLTSNIHTMLLNNPKGRMIISKFILTKLKRTISFYVRIKEYLLYMCYGIQLKLDFDYLKIQVPYRCAYILYLLAWGLNKYWNIKYNIKEQKQ